MYPELKQQIQNLDQELSEIEQDAIEMILSSNLDHIQEKLRDSYFELQSQLSIKLLLSENFEDLNLKHIQIKFKCLKNLKKYINSKLFEIELNEILDRIEELIFEKNSQDLDEILDFCSGFSTTAGICTSKETISGYTYRINEISVINDAINTIKKMIEQNKKKDIILDFISINFKNNQKILDRLALLFIDSGQIEISEDILSFVKKINIEKNYTLLEETEKKHMDLKDTFRILELIDSELVENFYLQDIPLDECYLALMQKAQELYENFENTLQIKIKNYKKTAIGAIPQIDGILAEFISQILDIQNQKLLLKSIRNLKKNKPVISFTRAIESITHFPLELQYIYCELLILFSENPGRTLNFLFCSDFFTKSMRLLPDDWAAHFIQRVCTSPFKDAFAKFNKGIPISSQDIEEVTRKIKLLFLPEGTSGLNLHNGSIVIKNFDGLLEKECTFTVYLHEIAHYLLRKDCLFIEDHMNNKSLETEGVKVLEGGEHLEQCLFGEVITKITFIASDFLMNSELPQQIGSFREKFLEYNRDNNMGSVVLKSSGGLYLGECGFRKVKIKK